QPLEMDKATPAAGTGSVPHGAGFCAPLARWLELASPSAALLCSSRRTHTRSSSNHQQQPLNRWIRWSWKCTEIVVLLSNGKTVSAQPKQNNNFWTMSNSTVQNHAPHY